MWSRFNPLCAIFVVFNPLCAMFNPLCASIFTPLCVI